MREDFRVVGRDGKPIAIVELKNRRGLSPQIAATYRRNLVAHEAVGDAPYLLILSQDRGYLWKDVSSGVLDAAPTAAFSMASVIQRYVGNLQNRWLFQTEFGLLVLQWLEDLASGRVDSSVEPERSLRQTGFSDMVLGGRIESGVGV